MTTTRYVSFQRTRWCTGGLQPFICADIYLLLLGVGEIACRYVGDDFVAVGERVMFVHARHRI